MSMDYGIGLGLKRGTEELLGQPMTNGSGDVTDSDAKKAKLDRTNTEPSRVIHLRNIPPDASDAEVMQLGLPFGKVTNCLMLKGKSQAFLEMGELGSAVAMVKYFANCPPALRERQVYIQYSNHKELKTDRQNSPMMGVGAAGAASSPLAGVGGMGILGAASPTLDGMMPGGMIPGGMMSPGGGGAGSGVSPVIKVAVEHMVYPVTIDILYQIFSRFGRVMKIITFVSKSNQQFQALIQMGSSGESAQSKMSLDGQNIYNGCCTLRIEFSKMASLNVKFNNDKSRDFTNPTLPAGNEDQGMLGSSTSINGLVNGVESSSSASPPPPPTTLPPLQPAQVIGGGGVWLEGLPLSPTSPHQQHTLYHHHPHHLQPPHFATASLPAAAIPPPVPHYIIHGVGPPAAAHHHPLGPLGLPTTPHYIPTISSPATLPMPFYEEVSLGMSPAALGHGGGMAGMAHHSLMGAMAGLSPVGMGMGNAVVLVSNLNEEMITPDHLFTLFGVYGDVIRVKILFNKKDNALIQYSDGNQAQLAIQHLNNVKVFGKLIRVAASKHSVVQLPKEGQPDAGLTKDFSTSALHRFKKPGSKNFQNIYPPSAVLHLSNIPAHVTEDELKTLFTSYGSVVGFKFFAKDRKMALVQLADQEEAIGSLMGLHNHQLGEQSHLRVSFSRAVIDNRGGGDQSID